MTSANPFAPFLASRGFALLDGGLATALEAAGHVLDSELWSAALLRDRPEAIAEVHRAFLDAGADCITTASYQASFAGFAAAGIDDEEAVTLLRRSSELALAARDAWVAERSAAGAGTTVDGRGEATPHGESTAADAPAGRPEPLVAASIGPYGAYLADGSEYDGRYGTSRDALDGFHRRRFELLASTGVDVMACETIPSGEEAAVLLGILDDQPDGIRAWMSFSCRDGARLHDGTPIEEVVGLCAEHERVAAVGVNCTAPRHVPELIQRAAKVVERAASEVGRAAAVGQAAAGTVERSGGAGGSPGGAGGLPLIAYPNSGEAYDAASGTWSGGPTSVEPDHDAWMRGVLGARRAGATILGGCCRVGPDAIAELRERLARRD